MSKRKFLAVMLVLAIMAPFFYIAIESVHECSGDDCQVCEIITECQTLIRKIGTGLILCGIIMSLRSITSSGSLFALSFSPRHNTLVSQKVRLND